MIRDVIKNKDRGETDADDEVRNLPLSVQKLRELMLRSGVSRSGLDILYRVLSIVLCLIYLLV